QASAAESSGVSVQPAIAVPNGEFSLYDFIADHERQFIANALTKSQGVKKHAAQLLQIPESTLRLKIKQYDIDMSNFGPLH
ncbi:MAG: helix-turn-helix domain-containing protein, partial [Candidatus Zixiibacteriota bacterium]